MGGVIDEHQARLESFVSCRCGDMSRMGVDAMEEDRRSELSYRTPDQAASPATIPSSAPLEASEDEATPTPAQPHYHQEEAVEWSADRWDCCPAKPRLTNQFEEDAECQDHSNPNGFLSVLGGLANLSRRPTVPVGDPYRKGRVESTKAMSASGRSLLRWSGILAQASP